MAIFRSWPLFDRLVLKYFSDKSGWTSVSEWDSEDVVALELFANAELQRRGAAAGGHEYVPGNRTIH